MYNLDGNERLHMERTHKYIQNLRKIELLRSHQSRVLHFPRLRLSRIVCRRLIRCCSFGLPPLLLLARSHKHQRYRPGTSTLGDWRMRVT